MYMMIRLESQPENPDPENSHQAFVYQKNNFFYFSANTYVVGTQKNRLNETVLLSTQNIC